MNESKNPASDISCCEPEITAPKNKKSAFFEWKDWKHPLFSLALLLGAIPLEFGAGGYFFSGWVRPLWYVMAYLPVALPVLSRAWSLIRKGEVFTEFFLMGLATLGAFAIGEYPEGVAVMLFYAVGELFQEAAVKKAKGNIQALLDMRPDRVTVWRNGQLHLVAPETVNPGETVQYKAGERVALDGKLQGEGGLFNTAALTGESLPRLIGTEEDVLAGMVILDRVVDIRVTKPFQESTIARILKLVQGAAARKAKTEQFIRKFAKVYTPMVTYLALALVVVPWFFVPEYDFSTWLYRALVFLVISCPCALVISIPLGYFGGIGAASKNGILFKGSNFLDLMAKVNTVVMDKTGTLTRGTFEVVKTVSTGGSLDESWKSLAADLERSSMHPIARSIVTHITPNLQDKLPVVSEQIEIAGMGIIGKIGNKAVIVGNHRLMLQQEVQGMITVVEPGRSVVHVAIDGIHQGYFLIADTLKVDAKKAISDLQKCGIKELFILSGDRQHVTDSVAKELGITQAFGELLPEEKANLLTSIQSTPNRIVAFVGDGINDAPVLALADVGIAMGGLGSDVAIETADVVIQTDQPTKIAKAIQIGRFTRQVVWQNILLAFGVKLAVLILGATGMASMWEAVFADVGVALLAILNAVRIQYR
ncbi:Lead, cadmium, zinc and mercury transporting ATPase [Lunatimonas lonarensis]|uniref:P-type Zn(2+) transporter n=1 Tax=Lunatimonas lonarensis TaxID=1232681 RepID=R7ZWK2_9BACT|nr:heavy metal translocating P-type ATPase [Lunatimonas lonarensis]EON78525.1 Lead, cadmium, zinc and mercury transporting ATPase [Lunatimonas lonarensis]